MPYCQCVILHCPLVDATRIPPPVHFVWPPRLFLTSYALLNVIICTTIHPFYLRTSRWAGSHDLQACLVWLMFSVWAENYKIHPFIHSYYNLSELSMKSLLSHFLPTSTLPPLPPPLLLSSDNHPGSAPILQLAASSFQNPGAPPHETKSKFQWSSRDDLRLRTHVHRNNEH